MVVVGGVVQTYSYFVYILNKIQLQTVSEEMYRSHTVDWFVGRSVSQRFWGKVVIFHSCYQTAVEAIVVSNSNTSKQNLGIGRHQSQFILQ